MRGTGAVSERVYDAIYRTIQSIFSEHSMLCEISSRFELSAECRTSLRRNHQRMGLSYGMSEALAELSSRFAMMIADADDFLSLSCSLGLKAMEQGMRSHLREIGAVVSVSSAIGINQLDNFLGANSIEDSFLSLAKSVDVNHDSIGFMKNSTPRMRLAAIFGVLTVLASALGCPNQKGTPGTESSDTAIVCFQKVILILCFN